MAKHKMFQCYSYFFSIFTGSIMTISGYNVTQFNKQKGLIKAFTDYYECVTRTEKDNTGYSHISVT
jgi:hypothetical protein